MSERCAIIVGDRGQDGRLLTHLLVRRGYNIVGIGRNTLDVHGNLPRPAACRISDPETVFGTVHQIQPDEIYYLAAHHASSQTQLPPDLYRDCLAGLQVNVAGVLHFLEAVRCFSAHSRLFYASSSLIFGNHPLVSPQDEAMPATPEEPYAICKKLASDACKEYRHRHGIFASVGILFNHESIFRSPSFLSMKIIRTALAARACPEQKVVIGNLNASVDWGYAPDFVDAFTRILALEDAGDYVIATGIAHTVRDFVAAAFGHLGLDWKNHVVEDPSVLIQPRTGRVGNPAKLKVQTGWQPSVTFEQMVPLLVDQVATQKHLSEPIEPEGGSCLPSGSIGPPT